VLGAAIVVATGYLGRGSYANVRERWFSFASYWRQWDVAFAGFFGVLTVRNDYRMNFIHRIRPTRCWSTRSRRRTSLS